MKLTCIALVVASLASVLAAEQPKASLSPVQAEAQARSTMSPLVDGGILDSPDEWVALLTADTRCDGAKVATLLVKLASSFKPVTTADEAIGVLLEHGVISSREYWAKNAVAGRTCDPELVLTVLGRVAGTLPVPRPKSADAAPLNPIAPADVKGAYDVVIAGAGTGGCGAAIQAARMGCSVLLLEET